MIINNTLQILITKIITLKMQITTALKKSENTEKRYVDTFIKKYVKHFKSEQELIERIEILMVDYLKTKG